MPRQARQKSESGIFHIMLRGINKQIIFEDNEDRERFLETMKRFKEVSKYEIIGYCLMNNHVHFLLKETGEFISTAVKRVCSSYVYWYNCKYGRCGHLFQERYKSETIESDEYLLSALRYIHQNPVKAGLSKTVNDYKWSSYIEYIDKPVIVNPNFVLQIFSSNREKAKDYFIDFTNIQNDDDCLDYDEKVRLSDNEVKGYFTHIGLRSNNEIQHMEREKRDEMVRKLKAIEGVTIRQLSRLTGISKSVIDRI